MISVIVPVYNNAPQLPRCLDSILYQQYKNLEIIAVNDGSSDSSSEILEQYKAKNANIRLIHQENQGVTVARLAGVAAARGDYIGFVDADDAIDPQMYLRLRENMEKHGAWISHCGYRMEFPDGRIHYFHNTESLEVHDRETALRELLRGEKIEPGLCNKLFARHLFSGLEMETDIRINEDLLMNAHLFLKSEKSVFEDFCPYRYIVRENSASRQKKDPGRIWDPIRVKQIILGICPPQLQAEAQGALLSTCLNVYNSLLPEGGRQFADDRRKLRQMICRQQKAAAQLCRRQRICVGMIRFAPWLYGPLYRFYEAYIQKNPYV